MFNDNLFGGKEVPVEREDGFRAARGLLWGCVLSLGLWMCALSVALVVLYFFWG